MDQDKEIAKLRKQLNIALRSLEHYSTWKNWARPYTVQGELGIKQSLYRRGNENGYDMAKIAIEDIKLLDED
jgi:hypothetical protein